MKYFSCLLLVALPLTSIRAQNGKHASFEPKEQSIYTTDVRLKGEFSINDSLQQYFRNSLSKKKLIVDRSYSLADDGPHLLLYFNMEHHYGTKAKSAIVAWMLNDTTAYSDVYTLRVNIWKGSGHPVLMPIIGFSPAYFGARVADYNFDGNADIYYTFYNTMGAVYGYGYILTYDPARHCLKLVPESIDIADPVIDAKHKRIISIDYSNEMADYENYKITYRYKWVGSRLRLASKRKISYGPWKR